MAHAAPGTLRGGRQGCAQYHPGGAVLDKCRACYEDDPEPLCVTGCPAGALKIGSLADMAREAEGRHCTIFTA